MRDMVLNHVSLKSPSERDATIWLADMARGMIHLVSSGIAQNGLRMFGHASDVWCRPDYSLYDAYQSLRPSDRDQYVWLMRLAQKVPIDQGLGPDAKDRLLACENLQPSGDGGKPLLLCGLIDGIAVGFPSACEWDRDQLHVTFEELLPNGEVERAEEDIDNLTRAAHAEAILLRDRQRRLGGATAESVWTDRGKIFPTLLFGPDVEGHLKKHARLLPTILGKLTALEESARGWQAGSEPRWTTLVTPESSHVLGTPKLQAERVFNSSSGRREIFHWHARIGSGFRVHFRFEAEDRTVEIGYIGPHLPLE